MICFVDKQLTDLQTQCSSLTLMLPGSQVNDTEYAKMFPHTIDSIIFLKYFFLLEIIHIF